MYVAPVASVFLVVPVALGLPVVPVAPVVRAAPAPMVAGDFYLPVALAVPAAVPSSSATMAIIVTVVLPFTWITTYETRPKRK